MDHVEVNGIALVRSGYAKPRVERLGTLRELTACEGISLLDWLFGRHTTGCALTGSSFHTWHRR
jgi:hypothetical protein